MSARPSYRPVDESDEGKLARKAKEAPFMVVGKSKFHLKVEETLATLTFIQFFRFNFALDYIILLNFRSVWIGGGVCGGSLQI